MPPPIDSQAFGHEGIEILGYRVFQLNPSPIKISQEEAGVFQVTRHCARAKLLPPQSLFECPKARLQCSRRRPRALGQSQQHVNRGCEPGTPVCFVHRRMSLALPVSSSPEVQVRLDVIGLDGVNANPALDYVAEKMPATDCVLFDGPSAELALAHVFAQRDQPSVNPMLFGNSASPGGGLLIG